MAADNLPDTDPQDAPDSSGPVFNPLQLVLRRWPLVAVGLAGGLVFGLFLHFWTAPTYQSSAQVLVIKKRGESTSGQNVAQIVVEDYVATQVTLLKSERIRKAAAKEVRQAKLNYPPKDEAQASEWIRSGLAVIRNKDANAPGVVGSGVLDLSFRGGDPADTKHILDAVIKAYQQDLFAIYDKATQERLAFLDKQIDYHKAERANVAAAGIKLKDEMRLITNEDVTSIRNRITEQRRRASELSLDLIKMDDTIKLVKAAPPDRRDRQAMYMQLVGDTRKIIEVSVTNPEVVLRQLDALIEEKGQELGKDHPQMKALRAQQAYYRELLNRQNPGSRADGILDELGVYGAFIENQARTSKVQLVELERRLVVDDKVLLEAGRLQDQIDVAAGKIKDIELTIGKLETEKQQTQATQGSGGYDAQPITPPGDGGKVAPVLFQSLLLGLALGLVFGGGAAAISEFTDRSFKSPAEIRKRLGLPVIGHVPQIRLDALPENDVGIDIEPTLACILRPKSVEAEAYRGVRTQLYFSTQGRGHQVIQVTSPNPGDGKSTLAANLAASVAQSGKRTVLIDCDLRKPRVHKIFHLGNQDTGLAEIIGGSAPLAAGLRRGPIPNLDVLPCGTRPANPAELLTSPEFQRVLADLRNQYDFVIIDTPPMLAVSDPAAVAPRVDGVILVFRMTKRARPAAERAREQLAALGANVLGVVVNGWTGAGRGYDYNYGSGGGYRYSDYQYVEDYADEAEGGDDGKK